MAWPEVSMRAPWIACADVPHLNPFPPCCAGTGASAHLRVGLCPIPRDHDADGAPCLQGPGERYVRVGPEPFAPDCSSACRHTPPEAPSPHPKPNSAFWNLPLFCITARDCKSGCLVGAVPMAFQTLRRSNHCMAACMCVQRDVIERARFCLCD